MKDLIKIRTFAQRPEAELAKGLLAAYGVEATISADDCGGFRPHLSLVTGGIQLLIKKEDKEKAEEI